MGGNVLIGGVAPDGSFIQARFTSDGKLLIDSSGSVSGAALFFTKDAGAAFAALDAIACSEVEIINTRAAAVDIEVQRGSTGPTVIVPAGGAQAFKVTNASDLRIKRFDSGATAITVTGEVRT
jgi:hypothetical protein